MDDRTKLLLANIVLFRVSANDYIQWAICNLEQGAASKNLGILAASNASDQLYEIEARFAKTLAELNVMYPQKCDVLKWYISSIARNILNRQVTENAGCAEIYAVWKFVTYQSRYDCDIPELTRWVYLDEGMDPDTYEWLTDPDHYPPQVSEKWATAIMGEAGQLVELYGDSLNT